MQILLNSNKNINSINVDTYQRLQLENKQTLITEYNINNVLSATEIFDAEREASNVYRIYGRIEYLSLLNGLSSQYTSLSNFFLPQVTVNSKTILNSFAFYLVKPGTNYGTFIGNTSQYVRYFDVIATPNDFEIYNAGFSKNVYKEQTYAFSINRDIDIGIYSDNFGFPLTELFLFAVYLPNVNGNQYTESLYRTAWDASGSPNKQPIYQTNYNVGDRIYGDLINYDNQSFTQTQITGQTYYIETPYRDDSNYVQSLEWEYNPFISLPLRYFSSSLNQANTGTTVYEQAGTIPYYAVSIGDGNYVWREILPQGYFDPASNLGVDYPFVNQKRYLFSSLILSISPSLLPNTNTKNVFEYIKFPDPTSLNISPNSDLANIGMPCK